MAISSLTKPRKRITEGFRALALELSTFGAEFRSLYHAAVASEMDKLRDIHSADNERISPAVYDAARRYHSVYWFPKVREAITSIRMGTLALSLIALISFMGGLIYILPRPASASHMTIIYLGCSVLAASLLLIGGIKIHARMSYRFAVKAQIVETALAFIAISRFQTWPAYVAHEWRSLIASISLAPERVSVKIEAVPIGGILEYALWFVAVICTISLIFRYINSQVKELTIDAQSLSLRSQPEEKCAEVIIELLNISHSLTIIPNFGRDGADPYSYSNEDYREMVWARRRMVHRLGFLAYIIRQRWHRAMRWECGRVCRSISQEASRIDLFLEHQQAKNLLCSNTTELSKVMESALVHAADGNWHLIGAGEEFANKAIARKRGRIIRRAIAIGVAIAGAFAVQHFMRHYPESTVQAIFITCIGFAGLQVLGLIDPDAPTGLDVAGRFASLLKRGGS